MKVETQVSINGLTLKDAMQDIVELTKSVSLYTQLAKDKEVSNHLLSNIHLCAAYQARLHLLTNYGVQYYNHDTVESINCMLDALNEKINGKA